MNIAITQPVLPHLDALIDKVASLNAFVASGALRTYQRDILTDRKFTFPCPFTGKLRSPNAHYVLPGSGVLYYIAAPRPYILVAASLKDAFPLLCVITAQDVIWFKKQERADLVTHAQNLLTTPPTHTVQNRLKPRITIGDPNFAHFLWNEFPALLEAIKHTTDFEVNLRFDPLGIMQRFTRNASLNLQQMTHPLESKGWSRSPAVCLGSTLCNTEAKVTAMTLMDLPEPTPDRRRIWLTVRDQGRTMENQIPFLNALIAAQLSQDPDTEFLIDGFSMPMDAQRPIYKNLRPKFDARVQGANHIIAQIKAENPSAKLHNMTGKSLRAALIKLATCTFYISHAGTMQHKPAWFYNLPGLQHSNHASLSPAALKWPALTIHQRHRYKHPTRPKCPE
jgi:hypothetical protein